MYNQKYENKIKDLKSEIQTLKGKRTDPTQPKEKKVELTKEAQILSKEEAKKRQEVLIKTGYHVTADGIWGTQSEKIWNEYQ